MSPVKSALLSHDLWHYILNIAIPIFQATFPNTEVLFFFDHATQHTADVLNALWASYMNMDPGGKQLHIRDRWYYELRGATFYTQKRCFDENDFFVREGWRGKPKEGRRVLQEWGLWPIGRLGHDCKSKKTKKNQAHSSNSCCTWQLLSLQPDFVEQKSQLQEQIEKWGH